jgi:putative adenylate-forming enzyme
LYSYAEVLDPPVRTYLGKVFGCPVHEVYQGSEGSYAMTCREGSLHINEDIVYLELQDEYGKPTPDGTPCCRLLVTDLYKTSQPVIRYAINDILTISPGKCTCGSAFRMIQRIQGRSEDLFWGLRNQTGERHFIYQDYISRKIIAISDEILDYQAIQESYTDIRIRLKVKPGSNLAEITGRIQSGIQDIYAAYDCLLPAVSVETGDPTINPRSGKLTRIICNIQDENYRKVPFA